MYYSPKANAVKNLDKVMRYKKVYENIVRRDTPQMQIDKLLIVDSIINGFLSDDIEKVSSNLIKDKIAKQDINSLYKYDQAAITFAKDQDLRLRQLYFKLLDRKYLPVVAEQQNKAVKEMEILIKKIVRDNPRAMKEL